MRRTYLLSLAILVTFFVALYPYLGAMEMCHSGECPYAAQTSTQSSTGSASLAGLCLLGAVLAVSSAGTLAFAVHRGRRLSDERLLPAQFFLAPEPPPPRFC
jgi:RsiW-degrading membrane proteinase PrsW (M82 family)